MQADRAELERQHKQHKQHLEQQKEHDNERGFER